MSKLGTKNKPAVVKVQTEERAMEIMALCNAKGWQVVVGIEPDEAENINDIKKLGMDKKKAFSFSSLPSRNAPCPCGSSKQYKRCCGN
ncbi:PBPRA1643 family SWIM/SEC-C metal-binding motif protein [Agriterribacter sp.]|uniref:PBPRA1643 family SWIM/SEC-C metal-binding motif protein n=1 Tax=Agriterribacter sp. TaxID=2821509 RepID=UPI002B87986D|nr:PBPRA1643 family SWIM/SEC-C metal-binding motif protein [Agriterribacter sp.]HRO47030.1 SEC-C metal-binding domain-containing protein [Agriterribacter sp.]HRQ17818.1 SEC-C metal-binding domain-containing protein [Agriterribacter sp.]